MTPQTEKTKRLPFFTTVFGSYNLLIEKFSKFFILATVFAAVVMFLSFVSGQEFMCGNSVFRNNHYCSQNFLLFVINRMLLIILYLMFISRWYRYALSGEKLSCKFLFVPNLRDIKITGLFLAYCLTLAIAIFSFYLLLVRIPNPNWKIEILYFTVVSSGFLVPVLAWRFLVYFAYISENVKCPSIKDIWYKTARNMFPILAFWCIFLIFVIFLMQISLRFVFIPNPTIYNAVLAEYLSAMIVFLIIACFTNYCYIQKSFFEEGNSHEQTK
ncbi:MAG: hypothetical protein MJ210_04925 [Alphaproteobacteria bacterium]|nr:hypothetical protein [Alphaproteobacteria bacterium]